jgi:hypothetical protein
VQVTKVILLRALFRLGMAASLLLGLPQMSAAQGNPGGDTRSVVGGVTSLPDAMLIYVARGAAGSCGENCSEWIAAEGTVYWDSYKRMIAGLDRLEGRNLPVFLNVRGRSDLRAALSVGKILRERGIDVGVGQTLVEPCGKLSVADCAALKRAGGPLSASQSTVEICDIACVLILAGGVRRTMPDTSRVVVQGTQVGHRLGLSVAEEIREGVHGQNYGQTKLYLTQMGLDPELADIIDANYGTSRNTILSRADVVRLRIVTSR